MFPAPDTSLPSWGRSICHDPKAAASAKHRKMEVLSSPRASPLLYHLLTPSVNICLAYLFVLFGMRLRGDEYRGLWETKTQKRLEKYPPFPFFVAIIYNYVNKKRFYIPDGFGSGAGRPVPPRRAAMGYI